MCDSSINLAIESLIYDFNRYPNKYFTEEDVRIHLCHFLLDHFGEIRETRDNDRSIGLHTEVRWWGPNKSRMLSDIIIFDVGDLEVTAEKVGKLKHLELIPNKGFSGNTPKAVIELKLRRHGGESDNQYKKKIKADVNKLELVRSWFHHNKPKCWVIALDKRNEINELNIISDTVNINYAFSAKYET